jgi:hypothetical protein
MVMLLPRSKPLSPRRPNALGRDARVPRVRQRRAGLALGILALLALATNVTWHVTHGRWFDCFWVCNGATLFAGLALLVRSQLLATAAFVWVVPGTVAWGTEALFFGSDFALPSYLLHLSGFAAALYGVWLLGAHRAGYQVGLALFAGLMLVSRALPPAANVNCAFAPRASWKGVWATFALPHHLTIAAIAFGLCWSMNRLALTWAKSRSLDPPP